MQHQYICDMNRNAWLIFKAVCAVVVGVLLIANPESYTTLMVRIIGGVFLLSGLMPLVGFWFPSKAGAMRPVFPVVGTGSMLLGLLLMLFPDTFVRWFMYVLAFLFLLGGCHQLLSQINARRMVPVRWWSVVLSLVLVALGIIILVNPMESASVPFFLMGLGCVCYGVTDLLRVARRMMYERRVSHGDEYVDYEEVTDDDTMRR